MKKFIFTLIIYCFLGCSDMLEEPTVVRTVLGFPEEYELAVKNNYDNAPETFGSGKWDLNQALLGTTSADRKIGKKSVRLKNEGFINMRFDVPNARQIEFYYGLYGSDTESSIDVMASYDQGQTWQLLKQLPVSEGVLKFVYIDIKTRKARFAIRKNVSDGSRINIDNFAVRSEFTPKEADK